MPNSELEDIYEVPAKDRFAKLDADRQTVLDRARDCSKLTIPSILPDEGHDENTALPTPYQALGSRLVNNLASKLLLSLLPPNTSFFRLIISDEVKQDIMEQGQEGVLNEVEAKLIQAEQSIQKQIEREALRVPTFEAIKDLVVTGNALAVKTDDNLKVYRLDNYVVLRDFRGTVTEVITRESVVKQTLPPSILEQMDDDTPTDTRLSIYTRAVLRQGTWYEYQYVEDIYVDNSITTLNKEKFPYIPLRWSAINGESYGRGLVEQYLGDFRSLEGLYQMMIETSAVMSRVLFGKRPGAQLDIDELNNAENGDFIFGDLEQDISVLRVEKGSDLQIPLNMIQDITRRLEQAFLVASSVARESERTTATEIRYMASDLEQALGGVYSVLSLEYQRPLAKMLLAQSGINLKSLGIDAVIVTGIEALGRNAELDKLRQFNALLQELGAPDQVLPRINIGAYISMLGNALELNTKPLIKSEQQLQMEQQAQQEQALMQQAGQGMVEQGVQAMGQQPQQ